MKKIFVAMLATTMLVVSVCAVEISTKFNDVSQNAYYVSALSWALDKQVVSGTSDKTFTPSANLKRQDMCVMLYKVLGSTNALAEELESNSSTKAIEEKKDYSDISAYAVHAMAVCYNMGVISGYTDGNLGPKNNITREEFVCMLVSAIKVTNFEKTLNIPEGFTSNALCECGDITSISKWALDKYQWAAACELISYKIAAVVKDNVQTLPKTCPKDTLTRAESVQMIYKAFGAENMALEYWNAKATGARVNYGTDDSYYNEPYYLTASSNDKNCYYTYDADYDMWYVESYTYDKDTNKLDIVLNGKTKQTITINGQAYGVNQCADEYSVGIISASDIVDWINARRTQDGERIGCLPYIFECDGNDVFAVHMTV